MVIDYLGLDSDFVNQYRRLYTKYGEQMLKLEGIDEDRLIPMNIFKAISDSNNVANASIDSSANVSSKTVSVIQKEAIKPLWKMFSHNKIYSELKDEFGKQIADEWLENQINGALYIHDSVSATFLPYCFSFSLKKVAENGLFFIDEMKGDRAKHLSTWVNHVCEFIGYASNSMSGAVAIPDVLVYMYKYWLDDVKEDNMTPEQADKYMKQQFQTFIFRINQPSVRDSIQSAYTNLQILDRPHLIEFFGEDTYPDGSPMIDYFDGFIEFQKKFLYYEKELRKKKFFTFPVLTASLKIDEDKEYEDVEVAKYVIKHNMEFQDVNIYNATEISGLSSCCRLVNDTRDIMAGKDEISGFFSSVGGTKISIGSVKIGTINFARIAYESRGNINAFMKILKDRVILTHRMLHIHRNIIKKNIKRGLLPIYEHDLMQLDKQFSTIGINGLFEAIKFMGGIEVNSIGEYKYSDKGIQMVFNIFDLIKEENSKTMERYGFTGNTEQIPGESTGKVLRDKDKLLFKNDIIENTAIYGNQWIPLAVKADVSDRIEASSNFDVRSSGGAILHINLGEQITDFDIAWKLACSLAKQGVIYYSIIHKFNYCKNDHSFFGETCPICNTKATGSAIKIVGYIVKEEYFHDARKEELNNRVFYSQNQLN